ncbi:MAG: asparagine synthase (glutamine-hydrolyzing) [Candidatus Omnitrophota bacterium]
MCGICGTVGFEKDDFVKKMTREMVHRGPDDSGIWHHNHVGLGHTRLSIIDTSDAGHQPMSNEDDTVWITFNGEIYNFMELRDSLQKKGHLFRSRTDTEIILHLYEECGESCLDQLRGMFAFAIWDKKKERLFAARDRFGIKPFFYHSIGNKFVFSSELRAIIKSGLVGKDIDEEAIRDYFMYGSVGAPRTIIKGVSQLLPAHYLVFEGSRLSIKKYWDLDFRPKVSGAVLGEREYACEIRTILEEAVRIRMVSDVPLGAFLSGGVDSSTIVALMQKHSPLPVSTFSIVFEETAYSERRHSEKVASRFGTNHREILLRGEDILRDMPSILDSMDQPSIDGFNTFVISRAVRDAGLTVALSGLGGDELFGGYSLFETLPRLFKAARAMKFFPGFIKRGTAGFLKNFIRTRQGQKLLFSFLDCGSLDELYFLKRSVFHKTDINSILTIAGTETSPFVRDTQGIGQTDLINRLSFLEITNYLQNTLLQDTDRMSMANSLEVRVPFLDHILVEKIFEIPGYLKVGKDYPKRLLVMSVKDLLPESIYTRPKKGFVFPFEQWFKGRLKDYCAEKFSTSSLKKIPFLDYTKTQSIWRDFQNGSGLYNYSSILSVISFVNWYEQNILK